MGSSGSPSLRAVLFDRDGTLVHDVPYNGDPARVRVMPHARESLQQLRARGHRHGGPEQPVGDRAGGSSPSAEVPAVNRRIEELLGPFDVWDFCPHLPEDRCPCRKPAPGMIVNACRRLGIAPAEAAYIGDIGSDVEAARGGGSPGRPGARRR